MLAGLIVIQKQLTEKRRQSLWGVIIQNTYMLNALRALLSEGVSPCGECRRRRDNTFNTWFTNGSSAFSHMTMNLWASMEGLIFMYGTAKLFACVSTSSVLINRVPPFSTFKKI